MDEPLEARLHRLAAAKGLRVKIKRRPTLKGRYTRVLVFDASSEHLLATLGSLERAEKFLTGPLRAR
jgi:hypothetical protein